MATGACALHSRRHGNFLQTPLGRTQADGLSRFQSTFIPGCPFFQIQDSTAHRPEHNRILKRPACAGPSEVISNFTTTTWRHVPASIRAQSSHTTTPPSSFPATTREANASSFSHHTPKHSRAATRRGSTICRVMGMASAQLKGIRDNIFIRHNDDDCWVCGADTGPLWGLTFALKDMYDVEGVPTGFGSPTWRKTHPVPKKTAPIVDVSAVTKFCAHCLSELFQDSCCVQQRS